MRRCADACFIWTRGVTINGNGQHRTAPDPYRTAIVVLVYVFDVLKYTVSQKTFCDYIFYNNFNNKCPITISVQLQQFLAQLVVDLCVIERWFHFPPHSPTVSHRLLKSSSWLEQKPVCLLHRIKAAIFRRSFAEEKPIQALDAWAIQWAYACSQNTI